MVLRHTCTTNITQRSIQLSTGTTMLVRVINSLTISLNIGDLSLIIISANFEFHSGDVWFR